MATSDNVVIQSLIQYLPSESATTESLLADSTGPGLTLLLSIFFLLSMRARYIRQLMKTGSRWQEMATKRPSRTSDLGS